MNQVRIMHLADFHLGLTFPFLEGLNEKRQSQMLQSFHQVCQLANEQKIDILLIAGDFLEAATISQAFLESIKQGLASIQAKVFLIAGNHDYYSFGSSYSQADWPANVHIFTENTISPIDLDDLNTSVYGASFTQTYVRESSLEGFRVQDPSRINLVLLHGDLYSKDGLYNSISKEAINQSQAEYIALGHIHKPCDINYEGKTAYAYAGSPFGQSFAETGKRSVIIGDISKEGMNFQRKYLKGPSFEVVRFDLSGLTTNHALAKAIKEKIDQSFDKAQENYYRIILEGYRQADFYVDTASLRSYFDAYQYLEILDQSRTGLDLDALEKEVSLEGFFVKGMIEKIDKAHASQNYDLQNQLTQALEMGLAILEQVKGG